MARFYCIGTKGSGSMEQKITNCSMMQEAKKFWIRASLEPEHSLEIIVIDKIYSHS
jgi:hypothetical protein